MRSRTQKQPQVKKELCRVLDYVNVFFTYDWNIKTNVMANYLLFDEVRNEISEK